MFIGNKLGLSSGPQIMLPIGSILNDTIGGFNSSSSSTFASLSSWSLSHTVPAGNNLLVVFLHTVSPIEVLSGLTFNGTNLTQVVKKQNPYTNNWMYGYILINPPVGTFNIVSTLSVPIIGSIAGVNISNTNTTTQPNTFHSNNTISSTFTMSTVTTLEYCYLVGFTTDSIGNSTGYNDTFRLPNFSTGSTLQCWRSTSARINPTMHYLNIQNANSGTEWSGVMMSIIPQSQV